MRIPRIFQEQELVVGGKLRLDERAVKHLVQVLRLSVGRELVIFNGSGGEYRAELTEANKRKAEAEILEYLETDRESSIRIHLAQCISKGERFEFALQKAVELGVTEITPVFSSRSQIKINHDRQDKKLKHWEKIALSACEQSGRTRLVDINEPVSLPDFLESVSENESTKLILHPETDTKLSDTKASGHYILLIGPEGGFEDDEIEFALDRGFTPARLGKQVLRTETAPVAAIAALNFLEREF